MEPINSPTGVNNTTTSSQGTNEAQPQGETSEAAGQEVLGAIFGSILTRAILNQTARSREIMQEVLEDE